MRKAAVAAALLFVFFVSMGATQEKRFEPSEMDIGKGMKIVEGRLSGYGRDFVVVNGEKLNLCEGCVVLDELEHPIQLSGLVATEAVQVRLVESCATEIKVLQVRQ